jgi:DNA-binding helix-hairpin-helix protein with protein kinase domain
LKGNASSQGEAALAELRSVEASITFPTQIKSDKEYADVGHALVIVQTTKKNIESKRRSVTRHIDAAKKEVMAQYAPMLTKLDGLRSRGDELMADWREEKRQIAAEARRREEEREQKRLARLAANEEKKLKEAKGRKAREAIKESYDEKRELVSAEQEARRSAIVAGTPKTAGVSVAKVWNYKQVLPWEAIALEFLNISLNRETIMKEIKLQLEAGRKTPSIRGLEIWQEESSRVKGL